MTTPATSSPLVGETPPAFQTQLPPSTTETLRGSYLERLGHSLSLIVDEGLAMLNALLDEGLAMLNALLDGILGALNQGLNQGLDQGLQSLPAGGGASPAVGFSGGSSIGSGSGSGGSSKAVLAILAILLLGGKYLWSTPDFLRPNSALRLVLERPG
jgi:hypothetical protein